MDSPEDVFRTISEHAGPLLLSMPDGETETNWILRQFDILALVPRLERRLQTGYGVDTPFPCIRLRHGARAEDVTFPELGYARVAAKSFEILKQLKDAGLVRENVRLQVNLPSPMTVTCVVVHEDDARALAPEYERAMIREVAHVLDAGANASSDERAPQQSRAIGERDATPHRWAADVAQLDETVVAFPHGYGTTLGERGINLSGGQKQRLALARALARRPRLVLLDDALSAVDTHTEAEILRGLRGALAGRTAVIASHRVSAVRDASWIIVLDGGHVVEQGTHDVLIGAGGRYASLLQRQQLEEALEGEDAAGEAGRATAGTGTGGSAG